MAWLIAALLVTVSLIYWQAIKKKLVRNQIENLVSNKSDSAYFIHYDSSSIDEVAGNASFYNISLQPDKDSAKSERTDRFNITVKSVKVTGVDIPGLISGNRVKAGSITIDNPVIYLIPQSGEKENRITADDSAAIYKKLLGNFNSINASSISIVNGQFIMSSSAGKPSLVVKDINVELRDFQIDSARNYDNIISYFIKDIKASSKEIIYTDSAKQLVTVAADVLYDARERMLQFGNLKYIREDQKQTSLDLNKTSLTGLNTDSFILQKKIQAVILRSDGGTVSVYRRKKAGNNKIMGALEIENNLFAEAMVNAVDVRGIDILLFDAEKPSAKPLLIKNAALEAADIQALHAGITLRKIINEASWKLSADGCTFSTVDKRYQVAIGEFMIDNSNASTKIKSFALMPLISENVFSKQIKVQQDLYTLRLSDILIRGLKIPMLLNGDGLQADEVSLTPDLFVFNDRTVAPNPASKIGKYPQQQLLNIPFPVQVDRMLVRNGKIAYKEKGAKSAQTGTVYFSKLSATVSNLTNIRENIRRNSEMKVNATALFLGVGQLKTQWDLSLISTKGDFKINGTLGRFGATSLNQITEPLGMAGVKNGTIHNLRFALKGDDYGAEGTAILLYNDLKIEVLKKEDNELVKKGVASAVANLFIRDHNPANGKTREALISEKRDTTKSFFNLAWKSIFNGVKRTAMGKDDEK